MMKEFTCRLMVLLGLVALFLSAAGAQTPPGTPNEPAAHVARLTVDGAIGPATADYLLKNMDDAQAQGARAVLVEIDTPGGLDAATRDIVQAILASPVPVITYVHPSGARAASAGTYILYASHVAAMTPATSLGAATPVQMGGKGSDGEEEDTEKDRGAKESTSAMERKVINDSVAFIRGLAKRHKRNAEWAEEAVRHAVSLPADEALEHRVIEIVSRDAAGVLAQAHGRQVQMSDGPTRLELEGLELVDYAPSWRDELLSLITNPQIAYILLLIGIYGLILEGYSPGAMVPGIVGVICLLTALYALQILPINYAGLALIIVGALLIVSEAFVPSFGILGIGGVFALVIGSIILMDTEVPEMMVSRELIGAVGAVSALLMLGILLMVRRSLRIPRLASEKAMVGRSAPVVHSEGKQGQVRIDGELWQVESQVPLGQGQHVRVIAQQGLTLTVEPDEETGNA